MQTLDLTVPFTTPNLTKLAVSRPDVEEDSQFIRYRITLRTAGNASASAVCTLEMLITNGFSTTIARETSPPVGLPLSDHRRYFKVSSLRTPTGYTDAVALYDAGGSGNKQAAFKAHLLSAGYIDPVTLAAT